MLDIIGLCYLFQVGQKLLFLFVPPLYFLLLLFEDLSIILGNVGGDGGKYGDTEEKAKKFSFQFMYC